MNRLLSGTSRDVALLLARVLLGTIMFAHGYQKLMIDGLGRTTQGFESMSIPVAIFSAAFVTVVEIVGGVLVVLGAVLPVVAACYLVVMVWAGVFVHARHGIFVEDGGWELVGAIVGLLLALAVTGSGRFGVDHLVRRRRERAVAAAPTRTMPVPAPPPAVPRPDPVSRATAFTEAAIAPRTGAFTDVRPRAAAEPPPVPRQPSTRFPTRNRGRGPRGGGS